MVQCIQFECENKINQISKIKDQKPYVIRLSIPEGQTKFIDIVRGKITIDNNNLDDQILLKSDGYPTYHLGVVVDDYLMKITHIIRGEEHLSNTPKQIILYNALNTAEYSDCIIFSHNIIGKIVLVIVDAII